MENGPARVVPLDGSLKLDATLHLLQDAVCLLRLPERQILDVNDAFLRLFGIERKEAIGQTTEILHLNHERFVEMGEHLRPAVDAGKPIQLEFPLRHASGRKLDVHFTWSPLDTPSLYVCILRDLTEAKAAEAERIRLAKLTEERLAPFETLLRTQSELGDAVVISGPHGIEWANPAFHALVGVAPEKVSAGGFRLSSLVAEEDLTQFESRWSTPSANGVAHFETRLRHQDGTLIPVEVSGKTTRENDRPRAFMILRDLRERRAAEAQLRTRSLVLDNMAEGVVVTTEDGAIIYTNPAEDTMFGYATGELVGRRVVDLSANTPDETWRRMASVIERVRERGHWDGEFANRRKDGSTFVTHARITRLDLDGKPHFICVQEDVSERRRLEDSERGNARLLKTLLRVQAELASNLDVDRVVQAATDAVTLLTEAGFGAFFYNVEDASGESYTLYALSGVPREAFSKFPMPRNTQVFGPTFRGEGIVRSDDITQDPRYGHNAPYRGMPAGHLPVRSYLAVPVTLREGKVVGGFFLGHPEPARFTKASEDIAVAIAAQAAVALDNASLYRRAKESEERWRRLVENAPVQIMTIDSTGRIRSLNRTARPIDVSTVIGTNLFDSVEEADRERVRGIVNGVMESGVPAEYETHVHIGEERWFNVRIAPIEGGAVIISTDVSQRKRDEREMALVRAQLIQGEKLAALGSLVSGVAHELRTPLTFISNNAFLAQQRLLRAAGRGATAREALDESARFLEDITSGIDRINGVVEDLRRYTRARQDATLADLPLHTMIAGAVELFRSVNGRTHVIETSLSATRAVRANQGAVQQLALNLLQNAAEASPPGKPVRIVTRDEGARAILEVSDQGEGMPPGVIERMYDPLFTTKSEGTGLGMSIVKRIADAHDATIECESAPGEGTRFRVSFPVV